MPHSHDDNHSHDVISTLSFAEKMIKRLEHWKRHNDSHAETYKEWAGKAKENDMGNIGLLLEDVFEMSVRISKKLDEALTVANNK